MPPDNPLTIGAGEDIAFPQDGATGGTTITRISDTEFNLAEISTYQVFFQVSVSEEGQLVLTLNGEELDYTVVGRETGTSQIVGMAYVTTTVADSVLTLRNPENSTTALTITPTAGGTEAVSAHLIIVHVEVEEYRTPDPYEIYVQAGATDGDGTRTKPFGTIEEGIAAVAPTGTVHILGGTYPITAQITVNKPGITLKDIPIQ